MIYLSIARLPVVVGGCNLLSPAAFSGALRVVVVVVGALTRNPIAR